MKIIKLNLVKTAPFVIGITVFLSTSPSRLILVSFLKSKERKKRSSCEKMVSKLLVRSTQSFSLAPIDSLLNLGIWF